MQSHHFLLIEKLQRRRCIGNFDRDEQTQRARVPRELLFLSERQVMREMRHEYSPTDYHGINASKILK
ncbi:hypothetical protein CEXT_452921, partial [Caerostris extrusa]